MSTSSKLYTTPSSINKLVNNIKNTTKEKTMFTNTTTVNDNRLAEAYRLAGEEALNNCELYFRLERNNEKMGVSGTYPLKHVSSAVHNDNITFTLYFDKVTIKLTRPVNPTLSVIQNYSIDIAELSYAKRYINTISKLQYELVLSDKMDMYANTPILVHTRTKNKWNLGKFLKVDTLINKIKRFL